MKLLADPHNPAQYLGACGLFELAANRDPALTSCWQADGLLIESLPDATFHQLMQDFAQAELVRDANWVGDDTIQPYVISNPDAGIHINMDWWERHDGRCNSFWKCFGGQQKSTDAAQMLAACKNLVGEVKPENMLFLNRPLTGRLGFDPRSAWKPIDVGFSPNDFGKRLSAIPTYPFAELLTALALQRWPFRPKGDNCRYHLWLQPVPLVLARLQAATGEGPAYEFSRVKRAQGLSCFTYSSLKTTARENQYQYARF